MTTWTSSARRELGEIEALEQRELLQTDRPGGPGQRLADGQARGTRARRRARATARQRARSSAGQEAPLRGDEAIDLLGDEPLVVRAPAFSISSSREPPRASSRIRLYVAASAGLRKSVPTRAAAGRARASRARCSAAPRCARSWHGSRRRPESRRSAYPIANSSTSSTRQVPNCSSRSSQPPNAPGTQAARTPVPGHELVPELAVALDRGGGGSDALAAERDRLAAGDRPEQRRHLAAGSVQVRLDDLERESGRDRRVERVAAALEHGHPGGRAEPVRRGDHPERAAQLGPRREARGPHAKIKHVVVPCASSLPAASRASLPRSRCASPCGDGPLAADQLRCPP